MVITMHTCRGNFKSTWMAEGGYEPVAERMFNLKPDGFFVEYDSERAGGFEPLRHVPKDKMIVLGLISSKTGQLESRDDIKRRVSEASRYVDLDRLCISPQCGFASSEEGNVLSEDEQWAKLAFVREVADEIWR
jgi:5-methyltetrahydropteroyltriglutamate--homocysteine methyltransferase